MPRRPLTIILAAMLQLVEAAALVGAGGFALFNTLLGRATELSFALPLVVLAFGAGAALGYAGWGLFQLREWARSPVVVTQIFALAIGVSVLRGGQYAIGTPLLVVALAVLAVIFLPPTTAALFPEESRRQRH